MKVYISADIEGIGCVVRQEQSTPDGREYAWARKMMTAEVNAAIRGAFDGGAQEVVVSDSHNVGLNLIPDELDQRAALIIGSPRPLCMMEGIALGFDAVFLVGYHDMAGTADSNLVHIFTRRIAEVRMNGTTVGEIGLSAGLAVFAVGTIFGMSDMLITNMDTSHHAVLPTHVYVYLTSYIDRDTILSLKEILGVEDVEPFNSANILYKLRPEDEWRQGVIQMRDDYNAQKYALLQLRKGLWPSGKNEIALERMAAQFLQIDMGDSVIFQIDDKERTFPITGLVRHPFVPPPQFADLAFFFMSGEGMQRPGVPEGRFSSIYVRVTPYSAEHAKEVARRHISWP